MQLDNATAEITPLEKDRARLSTDLHDDPSPMLSGVRLKINSFDLPVLEDRKQLVFTTEAIDKLALRLRAISYDLMPVTLQQKGLLTALREFTNNVSSKNGLKIRILSAERLPVIKDQKAIHIYRIVQEIIHNPLKHAGATELNIAFQLENGNLLLETQDNGSGFDTEKVQQSNPGLGLRSLENKTALLKASHLLRSEASRGTIHTFQIPMDHD